MFKIYIVNIMSNWHFLKDYFVHVFAGSGGSGSLFPQLWVWVLAVPFRVLTAALWVWGGVGACWLSFGFLVLWALDLTAVLWVQEYRLLGFRFPGLRFLHQCWVHGPAGLALGSGSTASDSGSVTSGFRFPGFSFGSAEQLWVPGFRSSFGFPVPAAQFQVRIPASAQLPV